MTDVLNLVQVEEGKEEPVDEGSVTLRNIADNGNYTIMQSLVMSPACTCLQLTLPFTSLALQYFHPIFFTQKLILIAS